MIFLLVAAVVLLVAVVLGVVALVHTLHKRHRTPLVVEPPVLVTRARIRQNGEWVDIRRRPDRS